MQHTDFKRKYRWFFGGKVPVLPLISPSKHHQIGFQCERCTIATHPLWRFVIALSGQIAKAFALKIDPHKKSPLLHGLLQSPH
jgi:hypothetical protein